MNDEMFNELLESVKQAELIMQIHPIHTEQAYENALARIEEIFNSKSGTKEGDELEILGILVD